MEDQMGDKYELTNGSRESSTLRLRLFAIQHPLHVVLVCSVCLFFR